MINDPFAVLVVLTAVVYISIQLARNIKVFRALGSVSGRDFAGDGVV